MQLVSEGKVLVKVPKVEKVSKEMGIFYNPVMKLNRDISVLLLNSIGKKDMRMADPLAASGIRGIRFLLELKKSKIKEVHFNDCMKSFKRILTNNLKLNKLKIGSRIMAHNTDATLFLLQSFGFDYIDIDPFGSPNPYLDSAVRRLSRDGIIAVTATDTSALAGTYPDACIRKYWAVPLKNELMHEIGLRILIRKVQLIAAQYNRALVPIFSYSKDHYMRIFLICEKARKAADNILKQHGFFNNAGPLWLGSLWDKQLVAKMVKNNNVRENAKFLSIIKAEAAIGAIGFYSIPEIARRHNLKKLPRQDAIISAIVKKGYKAAITHFHGNSIRSNIDEDNLISILRSLC